MRKKRFRSFVKRTTALTLAFVMLGSSTSIPEALIRSGLIQYLGCVGENIVRYYNAHKIYAEELGDGDEIGGVTKDDIAAIIRENMPGQSIDNSTNYDIDITHSCDHTTVNTHLNAIEIAAEAIQKAMGEATDKGTLTSMVKQILEDTGLMQEDLKIIKEEHLSAIVGALYDNTSPKNEDGSYKNPDDVDEWIGGRSIANILLYYSDMMEMWFEFGETAGPQLDDDGNQTEESKEDNKGSGLDSKSLGVYMLHDEKDKLDVYSYYTISNNISSTRKTLQLGLGYTQPDGDLLNKGEDPDIKDLFWDKDKVGSNDPRMNGMYLEVERETRNLSNEVSNIWYNLNDNFGYYQYSHQGKGDDAYKHWSQWDASLARDFRELLSMYRIYNVAHVYSLNSELNTSWQPTPEELTYAKERVLNKGYVNAYLGYWQEKAADYNSRKPSKERYLEVLGDDILTSHEAYIVEVLPYTKEVDKVKTQEMWDPVIQGWKTVEFEYKDIETTYVLNAEHVYKTMDLTSPITLSDAVRILYRALGQDVITYYTYTCADPNITLETSPCSVGLPNPLSLAGDSVYMAAIRNNVSKVSVEQGLFGFDDNIRDVSGSGSTGGDNLVEIKQAAQYIKAVDGTPNDVYMTKAREDGVVNNDFSDEKAQEYYLTNSEFWVLASNLMQIYGEPEMNSTETLSLLQVYGDDYPIQSGNQIADAWAYLKARGVLDKEDDTVSNYMNALDALNIAMRVKDKDSRLNYKEINLTVSLEQAVVDNGFFPLFESKLELVDNYNVSVEYDYTSATDYNIVIPLSTRPDGSIKASVTVGKADGTMVPTSDVGTSVVFGNDDFDYLLLTIPYSLTDITCLQVTLGEQSWMFTNTQLASDAGVAYFDGAGNLVEIYPFDHEHNAEHKNKYVYYVDHVRHKKEPEFILPPSDATLSERIGYFFAYIFTPHTVYAAEETSTNTTPICGNTSGITYTYTITGTSDNARLVMLALMHPYHVDPSESIMAESTVLGKYTTALYEWVSSSRPGSAFVMEDDVYGQMTTAGRFIEPGKSSMDSISDLWGAWKASKVGNYSGLKSYAYGFSQNFDSVKNVQVVQNFGQIGSNALFKSMPSAESDMIDKYVQDIMQGKYTYTISSSDAKDVSVQNIKLTITGTDKDAIEDTINTLSFNNNKITLINKSELSDALDSSKDNTQSESGFAGGSIDEVRNLYPNQIMNRNADMYIAYQELVRQGIVQTRKTPTPDSNGCISFYLTNRGQVVIDTVNNTAAINCVYLNMDNEISPIYKTEKDLYINYACLVGALATYEIDRSDGKVVEEKTVTGSGSNATYQLCNGIVASNKVDTVETNVYNVENGNTTGVKAHVLFKYNSTELTKDTLEETPAEDSEATENPTIKDIGDAEPKVMLLSGVFPTSNWVIVEASQGAYLYTFYNRKMFYASYKNEAMNMSLSGYWGDDFMYDTGDAGWATDSKNSSDVAEELSIIKRVKVGNELALTRIEETYGMPYDTVGSIPVLNSTYEALLSLANETGSLVVNPDLLCRRYIIPYATSLSDIPEGTVAYLETVGYVMNVPEYTGITDDEKKGYDHTKYVSGELWLPYEYNAGKVVEYNMNTYGAVTINGLSQIDLPYGYTISISSTEVDEGMWENDYTVGYVLHGETDSRVETGDGSFEFTTKVNVSGDIMKLSQRHGIVPYTLQLSNDSCFVGAPVGLFKEITTIVKDKVKIGTLNKYTTSQCYFYLGSRRLSYINSKTGGASTGFNFYNAEGASDEPLINLDNEGLAIVTTRDYYGRHHFVLSPNTTVVNAVSINTVNAEDYAIDYSDNPFYSKIKAWITNLDEVSSVILYILFYVVPYILLIWILLLVMLALIPNKAVRGISTLIGLDVVSILTVGRREAIEWHGYRVVMPLIIAFVALGLFYGPNLLRMIEIISDFAYKISGLV